jgi:hypothetical protein
VCFTWFSISAGEIGVKLIFISTKPGLGEDEIEDEGGVANGDEASSNNGIAVVAPSTGGTESGSSSESQLLHQTESEVLRNAGSEGGGTHRPCSRRAEGEMLARRLSPCTQHKTSRRSMCTSWYCATAVPFHGMNCG